jgi:hypothetical protein
MRHPLFCILNHLNTANHNYQCTLRSLLAGLGTKIPPSKVKIHEKLAPSLNIVLLSLVSFFTFQKILLWELFFSPQLLAHHAVWLEGPFELLRNFVSPIH